jgi:hypothetical protein
VGSVSLSSRGPRSSRRVSSSATRRLPALAQRFEIYYYRIHVPAAGTRGPMILRRLRYHLLYSCTRTMQSQIDAAVGRPPLSGAARCKPVSRVACALFPRGTPTRRHGLSARLTCLPMSTGRATSSNPRPGPWWMSSIGGSFGGADA